MFVLPEGTTWAHAPGCPCCGPGRAIRTTLRWATDSYLCRLDPTQAARLRADELSDGLAGGAEDGENDGESGGESGGDEWAEFELLLAALLAAAIQDRGAGVIEDFSATLATYGFNSERILEAVARGQTTMGTTFDDVAADVSEIIPQTVARGVIQVAPAAPTILAEVPSRLTVEQGIVRATKYYTNEFFNRQIVPAIMAEIDKAMNPVDPFAVPDLQPILEILNTRLKSVPYWRVVANAAASRGYHYGLLRAAEAQGLRGYILVAVLDSRTSKICRFMNGRQFWVSDAVRLIERIAAAESPEEVKTYAPWHKFKDIDGKTADDLKAMGFIIPPFHGNCRTTVRALP